MRTTKAVSAAILFAVLTILGIGMFAGPANATDPVTLGSSHVLDQSNVLSSGDKTAIENAAKQLSSQHKLDLWVVFVPTFTGQTSAQSWANTTASQNNLGPNQYLLAVATNKSARAYYLSGDSSGPVSDSKLTSIEQNNIQPQLASGNWRGAALAAASGLGGAVGGGGGGGWAFVIFIVIAVVVVGAIIFFVSRRRRAVAGGAGAGGRGKGPVDELAALPLPELERRAGGTLVQTDDAIRTSEQEVGFATASYGEDAVKPFTAALEQAKVDLRQAFQLKQKLDDAIPDTEQQKREWNAEIVHLCAHANKVLDERAAEFDQLRALEKNLPDAIAKATADADAAAARVTQLNASIESLRSQYAPDAFTTVADNEAQANERLTFARTAITTAQQAITAGDTGRAAVGVRGAEVAVSQAEGLVDAVDHAATDLTTARQKIDTVIADLEGDLTQAKQLQASADPAAAAAQGPIGGAIASTEQTISSVRASLAAPPVNPLALIAQLEQANTTIDGVLEGVRDAQAQAKRLQSSLDQTLLAARSKVSAAEDFIVARRGAVGPDARTRLAEAGRLSVQAQSIAVTDPQNALAAAQRADQLADEAIQLAQQDVSGFGGMAGQAGYGQGGGLFGGGGGGGNGALGAVLGGILIGDVLGGGGGGLFGGGGGGGGGFGDVFGGGGGMGPGSFGGGGTRDRNGGGRF